MICYASRHLIKSSSIFSRRTPSPIWTTTARADPPAATVVAVSITATVAAWSQSLTTTTTWAPGCPHRCRGTRRTSPGGWGRSTKRWAWSTLHSPPKPREEEVSSNFNYRTCPSPLNVFIPSIASLAISAKFFLFLRWRGGPLCSGRSDDGAKNDGKKNLQDLCRIQGLPGLSSRDGPQLQEFSGGSLARRRHVQHVHWKWGSREEQQEGISGQKKIPLHQFRVFHGVWR